MTFLRGKKRLDFEAMLGIATISTQSTITICHIPNTNRAISDPKTTAMTTNYISMHNLINTTLKFRILCEKFHIIFIDGMNQRIEYTAEH